MGVFLPVFPAVDSEPRRRRRGRRRHFSPRGVTATTALVPLSSPRNSFFSRSCCWQAVRRRRRRGAYCFPPCAVPLHAVGLSPRARLFFCGDGGGGDQNGTRKGEGKHPSLVPQPPPLPASFSPPRPTSSCANWPLPAAAAAPWRLVAPYRSFRHCGSKTEMENLTQGGGGRRRPPHRKKKRGIPRATVGP